MPTIGTLAAAMISLSAQAQPFEYLGSIPAAGRPLPLAGDANGGLYYGAFNASLSATTEFVYYVASPEAEIGALDATSHVAFGGQSFDPDRGWQGLAVGASGEVYLSGDRGGALGSYLFKCGSAPAFAPDAAFNANAGSIANPTRYEGLALMNDQTLALCLFSTIDFRSAADGTTTGYTATDTGINYQRECLYNSVDNVLYALKNGNNQSAMLAGYYANGTVASGGYTFNAASLIPSGADSTNFGISTGHGFIDTTVSPPLLYAVETATPNPQLRAFRVGGGGASLTEIGGISSALGNAGWLSINDCVKIGDTLYLSSTASQEIFAYGPATTTGVSGFAGYR